MIFYLRIINFDIIFFIKILKFRIFTLNDIDVYFNFFFHLYIFEKRINFLSNYKLNLKIN